MNDDEAYILLLLSDSNLPTGSFVASSGLESYVKHGFASSPDSATINFVRDSLVSYAHSALPFVSDAHRAVSRLNLPDSDNKNHSVVVDSLSALDNLYDTMTLNHVAKRASKSQGIALLSLYSKGFSRPSSLSSFLDEDMESHQSRMKNLFEGFKLRVRREEGHGHLPVCWGALTAALGLTLERSQYLHLFLHARSLLSASIRLNDMGPYAAQQILLYAVRPLVAAEALRCRDLRTGLLERSEDGFDETLEGPANTWPLGEILVARHDLQHSRIFNS